MQNVKIRNCSYHLSIKTFDCRAPPSKITAVTGLHKTLLYDKSTRRSVNDFITVDTGTETVRCSTQRPLINEIIAHCERYYSSVRQAALIAVPRCMYSRDGATHFAVIATLEKARHRPRKHWVAWGQLATTFSSGGPGTFLTPTFSMLRGAFKKFCNSIYYSILRNLHNLLISKSIFFTLLCWVCCGYDVL